MIEADVDSLADRRNHAAGGKRQIELENRIKWDQAIGVRRVHCNPATSRGSQGLCRESVGRGRHFPGDSRGQHIGEIVIEAHPYIGRVRAQERRIFLAYDDPSCGRGEIDHVGDNLALSDEAADWIPSVCQHEQPIARTLHRYIASPLPGAHQSGLRILESRACTVERYAIERVKSLQAQLQLTHVRLVRLHARLDRGVSGLNQRLPGIDPSIRGDQHRLDEPIGSGPNVGPLGQPDHALGPSSDRDRQGEEKRPDKGQKPQASEHGPPPPLSDGRIGEYERQLTQQRKHRSQHQRRHCKHHAHDEEVRREVERDPEEYANFVHRGRNPITKKPRRFPRRRFGRRDVVHPEQDALRDRCQILVRLRREIRNLEPIREHVIAIEAQQRISIEQQSRNAADQHHRVRDLADHSRFDCEPHQECQCSQEEFDRNPRGSDGHTSMLRDEYRRCRGVHVGNRHEDEKQHSNLVHFAAPAFHREGVAQLVEYLDDWIGEPNGDQALGLEQRTRGRGQLGAMPKPRQHRGCNHRTPEDHAAARKERRSPPLPPGQKLIGIQQRHSKRNRIQPAPGLFVFALPGLPKQLGRIGRDIAAQHICPVEQTHHPDHLFLGWGIVSKPQERRRPDLLRGPLAVHGRDEMMGGRGQPVYAAGCGVLNDEPGLAPVNVTMKSHLSTESRPQVCDVVPGRTVEGLHGVVPMADMTTAAAAANRGVRGSRSKAVVGFRFRSLRRLPCPAAGPPKALRGLPRPGSSCVHRARSRSA